MTASVMLTSSDAHCAVSRNRSLPVSCRDIKDQPLWDDVISPCLLKKVNEGKDSPLCRCDVDCVAMAVITWLSNWQGCRTGPLNTDLLGWYPWRKIEY